MLHGAPGAPATIDRRERRLQGWETLVVLSVFPLAATFSALVLLIEHLTLDIAIDAPIAIRAPLWVDLLLNVIFLLLELSAVFLVWYLMVRSGEGLTAINLGGRRWRTDLAFLLPVFFAVFLLPLWLGRGILAAAGLHAYAVIGPEFSARWADVALQCVHGAVSGVIEEVVVLGFLVRRLEQRGWPVAAIVVVDAGVRLSYHVYYGPGVIEVAPWAVVSVLVYLRIRRLLPFIICHAIYDVGLEIRAAYHVAYVALAVAAIIVGLGFTMLWARWVRADGGSGGGRAAATDVLGPRGRLRLMGQRPPSESLGRVSS
ncbi:MAG TPA: CPBP family intramembrane glutamic endopeptidase [Acidimicrobiales bacterium]